jgi:hypothetical protein
VSRCFTVPVPSDPCPSFGPILFKQVPYTMAKFAVFEVASEKLLQVTGVVKSQMTGGQTTALNLSAGLIAGLAAAVVSCRLGRFGRSDRLDFPTRRHSLVQDQQDQGRARTGCCLPLGLHVQAARCQGSLHRHVRSFGHDRYPHRRPVYVYPSCNRSSTDDPSPRRPRHRPVPYLQCTSLFIESITHADILLASSTPRSRP